MNWYNGTPQNVLQKLNVNPQSGLAENELAGWSGDDGGGVGETIR